MKPRSGKPVRARGSAASAGMRRLRDSLANKLSEAQAMVRAFDEGMDYATHCSLEGFAQGLAFALEEVEEAMRQEAVQKKGGAQRGMRK